MTLGDNKMYTHIYQVKTVRTFDEEQQKPVWSVMRYDGKSFENGVISYNFEYTSEGALLALACQKRLQYKFCSESL